MYEGFKINRADIGGTVGELELARRLSYELQLPHSYGKRLMKAYKRVIEDALMAGEGINLGVGIIKMHEYKDSVHINGFHQGKKRSRMYYYNWSTTNYGEDNIAVLTKENFNRI